jgi:hypothetical protein
MKIKVYYQYLRSSKTGLLSIRLLWDIILCLLESSGRLFELPQCLHIQGKGVQGWIKLSTKIILGLNYPVD